jgi:hypothetical protein
MLTALVEHVIYVFSSPAHLSIHPSICSCCTHLGRRASVKRFVSLQYLNLEQSFSPSQGCLSTQDNTHNNFRNIHDLSGMRAHYPIVQASEDIYALDRAATVTSLNHLFHVYYKRVRPYGAIIRCIWFVRLLHCILILYFHVVHTQHKGPRNTAPLPTKTRSIKRSATRKNTGWNAFKPF